MRNRETPWLDFYKKASKSGIRCYYVRTLKTGLCGALPAWMTIGLRGQFHPTKKDIKSLQLVGDEVTFWGSGDPRPLLGQFTPLRQTIVLFMAAINGEL